MRSEENIERSLKQADLDVEISAKADRAILSELIETQEKVSEAQRRAGGRAGHRLGTRLAAAAVITILAAVLISRHVAREPEPPRTEARTASAIEMATALSLENAFRRGGLEAVDEQSRRAFGGSRKPPERTSIQTLLGELNAMDTKAGR